MNFYNSSPETILLMKESVDNVKRIVKCVNKEYQQAGSNKAMLY